MARRASSSEVRWKFGSFSTFLNLYPPPGGGTTRDGDGGSGGVFLLLRKRPLRAVRSRSTAAAASLLILGCFDGGDELGIRRRTSPSQRLHSFSGCFDVRSVVRLLHRSSKPKTSEQDARNADGKTKGRAPGHPATGKVEGEEEWKWMRDRSCGEAFLYNIEPIMVEFIGPERSEYWKYPRPRVRHHPPHHHHHHPVMPSSHTKAGITVLLGTTAALTASPSSSARFSSSDSRNT